MRHLKESLSASSIESVWRARGEIKIDWKSSQSLSSIEGNCSDEDVYHRVLAMVCVVVISW